MRKIDESRNFSEGSAQMVGGRSVDRALDRSHAYIPRHLRGWREVCSFLCWYIRISVLVIPSIISSRIPFHRLPRQEQTLVSDDILSGMFKGLELYIDFAILEGRTQGTLQAFEGIRMVKERKKVVRS
jgi:hypothetical protein